MTFALAELRRGKLRFGLPAAAIGLLVFLALFLAMLERTLVGSETGALAGNSADVFVYSATAHRNLQASRLDQRIVPRIAGVGGVRSAAGFGEADLTADPGGARGMPPMMGMGPMTASGATTLTLFGVAPGRPGAPHSLSGGRWPGAGEAVVDRADTASGYTLGSVMTLRPSGVQLRIVGYVSGARYGGGPTAYSTVAQWQHIVRRGNPQTSSVPLNLVAVHAAPGISAAALARRITRSGVPGVVALDRADAVSAIPGVALIASTFRLLIGITFAIAVLVTGLFLLLITVQKLGVLLALRALGASIGLLARALVVQIAVLVAVGTAIGIIVLAGATTMMASSAPIAVDYGLVGDVFAALLTCSAVTALIPMRRIAALDPANVTATR